MKTKFTPEYSGTLRSHLLTVPKCISECGGIRIFGRRIKSLVFSTDVAIIKNVNADAIIAVYPFTPQPSITQAIISVSEVPVFVGVGGGMTNGDRSVRLAEFSEHQGASGVVVNAPISNETIAKMKAVVDIPVVTTIVSGDMDIAGRLAAGPGSEPEILRSVCRSPYSISPPAYSVPPRRTESSQWNRLTPRRATQ